MSLSTLRTSFLRTSPRLSLVAQFQRRTVVTLKENKYTAYATAQGAGRNGNVGLDDKSLSVNLSLPKEMGGRGDGHNPEQLFAMGYASCLLGAIQAQARALGRPDAAKNAAVHAQVHIGPPENLNGFGIAVDIKVEGVEDDEVIAAGHEFCPYSRALKHGAVVNVSKA